MKRIIELADVKDENPYLVEKLETGIYQIDNLLHGGLPFGGLVLVGGKRGEGKSTLASQILANSIEQGYKSFAYSGELPNRAFKSTIDFQIAGTHIVVKETKDGRQYNSVSDANKKIISDWYRGKCFLYDNSCLDGEETESLVNITENVIMQYGVRVVLLDNLMTAIDLETKQSSDKNEMQSSFVKKLARLALKHNVLIILVAHKRKNNFSTDANDEISGSGDITNLASVIISYERDKDAGQYQRVSKVTKNRLFGELELNGYKLDYDFKSKRIYGDGDDVTKEFSWNKQEDGFYSTEEFPF
jgi:KaiC/GvpD/RAD55 family RecA-like ATPase